MSRSNTDILKSQEPNGPPNLQRQTLRFGRLPDGGPPDSDERLRDEPWYAGDPKEVFMRPPSDDPWGVLAILPQDPPPQQKPLGLELPCVTRSSRCPGESCIPQVLRDLWADIPPDAAKKKPKVYVLMVPGVADAVNADWAKQELETPDHFEFATWEWPGHGERLKEERKTSVAELGADCFETFREAMCTGSFILVGHSCGVLMMTYVAWRAERELGLKPLLVFALDRLAPNYTVYSPYSNHLNRNAPETWLSMWRSSVYEAYKRGQTGADDTFDMMVKDERVMDDILEVGMFKFTCPVHCFISVWMSSKYPWPQHRAHIDEQHHDYYEHRGRLFVNAKGYNSDVEDFIGWEDWADDLKFYKVEADHKGVVTHSRFLTVLYKEIDGLLKKAKPPKAKAKAKR